MLTRLEVQGFKNLLDVHVDFGPFTCIAGANGIGKSNVFDAIEFLSYLATDTLVEASQRVRGASGIRGGDPRDLFWDGYKDHPRHISLAAEMIVPTEVEDDLGAPAKPTTTFLRYELELEYIPPEGEQYRTAGSPTGGAPSHQPWRCGKTPSLPAQREEFSERCSARSAQRWSIPVH